MPLVGWDFPLILLSTWRNFRFNLGWMTCIWYFRVRRKFFFFKLRDLAVGQFLLSSMFPTLFSAFFQMPHTSVGHCIPGQSQALSQTWGACSGGATSPPFRNPAEQSIWRRFKQKGSLCLCCPASLRKYKVPCINSPAGKQISSARRDKIAAQNYNTLIDWNILILLQTSGSSLSHFQLFSCW